MPDYFLLETQDGVATLTFNCPERRNPLNEGSLAELEARLRAVAEDPQVRVLILTGVANTFCAGVDLSETKGIADPQERRKVFAPLSRRRARLIARVVDLLANLELPTIAAVNGFAIGGGWSLALACDFRVGVEEARCWFPEVELGVPLSPPSTALVVAHAGPVLAKEIIINCRRFSAREQLALGLLTKVVPQEELMASAREMAHALARNPHAVMVTKATINAFARGQAPLQTDLMLARD